MIIVGILLIIFGILLFINGDSVNNDLDLQMESIFNDGTTNPGDTYLFFGVLCIILGVILLVFGIYKRIKENEEVPKNAKEVEDKTLICIKCGAKNPLLSNYCIGCGDNLMLQEEIVFTCQSCGKELPEGSRFCNFCGNEVEEYYLKVGN